MMCRVLLSTSAFLDSIEYANEFKKHFNFHVLLSKNIKFRKLTADKSIIMDPHQRL